jgi:preprotein translocase subunit Sss1
MEDKVEELDQTVKDHERMLRKCKLGHDERPNL